MFRDFLKFYFSLVSFSPHCQHFQTVRQAVCTSLANRPHNECFSICFSMQCQKTRQMTESDDSGSLLDILTFLWRFLTSEFSFSLASFFFNCQSHMKKSWSMWWNLRLIHLWDIRLDLAWSHILFIETIRSLFKDIIDKNTDRTSSEPLSVSDTFIHICKYVWNHSAFMSTFKNGVKKYTLEFIQSSDYTSIRI